MWEDFRTCTFSITTCGFRKRFPCHSLVRKDGTAARCSGKILLRSSCNGIDKLATLLAMCVQVLVRCRMCYADLVIFRGAPWALRHIYYDRRMDGNVPQLYRNQWWFVWTRIHTSYFPSFMLQASAISINYSWRSKVSVDWAVFVNGSRRWLLCILLAATHQWKRGSLASLFFMRKGFCGYQVFRVLMDVDWCLSLFLQFVQVLKLCFCKQELVQTTAKL